MVDWVKNHKLSSFLLLVVAFFIYNYSNFFGLNPLANKNYYLGEAMDYSVPQSVGGSFSPSLKMSLSSSSNKADRIIVQDTNLSLLVADVRKTGNQIVSYAEQNGGYMVYSSYYKSGETPSGTIEIRVQTSKLKEALKYFDSLSLKVINENLMGTDITDQYKDVDARLTTLRTTQKKFNSMLDKASAIADILSIQRELINIQDQIDALVGQKKAMDENVKLTKISVYLSTDELALPYAPDNIFRPDVIFKLAVRSVVATFQFIGQALIWVAVYSVIWIPLLSGYMIYKRRKKKNSCR